jgi:filamentous hemagglutinin family protein
MAFFIQRPKTAARGSTTGGRRPSGLLSTLVLASALAADPAQAQVTPDGTLPTGVTRSGDSFTIDGGTRSGTHLFHSFSQFSVPSGGAAIFNNAADVRNIFSRVTGGSASNIDGAIQANGSANLFLLNPSGILFGPNASLNIGGSFLATTANSIQFADGTQFSAVNPDASPLLTLSVPIGLQFGPTPGDIALTGAMLSGAPGSALILAGGNITQSGGELDSQGGPIGLAAVQQSGLVSLSPDWQLGFGGITQLGDIQLTDRAYLHANGEAGGPIQFVGRQIRVTGESVAESVTLGSANGGTFTITASELLEISGLSLDGSLFSYVQTFNDPASSGRSGDLRVSAPTVLLDGTTLTAATTGSGDAGHLTLDAQRLTLRQGAQIGTFTFASGNAGDLTVNVTDSIDVAGSYLTYLADENITRTFSSGLFANLERGGSGNGGNLTVTTGQLRIADGGRVTTSVDALAQGNAGNLRIQAQDVLIDGVTVDELGTYSGLLANVPAGTSGRSGSLVVTADRLRILHGGQLSAANLGQGDAGGIEIHARTIEISGTSADGAIPSRLSASSASAAAAGFINITADSVNLNDQAIISVSSLGTGSAGNLSIQANRLQLRHSKLQAEAGGGNQGNIRLDLSDALILRDGSDITTNAMGNAAGGNITINAPIVLGLENSDIVANAIKGQGGNIQITTQGLFGLQRRPQLTPDNDITASSEFGVSGTVQVNRIGVDPNSGMVALLVDVVDPSQKIATGCAGRQSASFVMTGRGGVPPSPSQNGLNDQTWQDLRPVPGASLASNSAQAAVSLVEATTWQRNTQGQPELIASGPTTATKPPVATCAR